LTLAGLMEYTYGPGSYWLKKATAKERRQIASDFHAVSPHSPNALVLGMLYAEEVDMDQLTLWESEAGENPIAWLSLGGLYYQQQEMEAAVRCYQRSLEISPSFSATEGLANAYLHGGKENLWAPTMESYLQYEDLGLAHGNIHDRIAKHHIDKRNWKEALPHAEAAAQTWSGWGLLLAGRVNEGLHNWERSEYWMAEAARAYPSYTSGIEWYLWCRRTGRGDLLAPSCI